MQTEETAVLVKRLQAGEDAAFDELFSRYQKQAVRTAALIIGDNALAEDAVQEAFVTCLLYIKELRQPERFKPWFFRILTRAAWKAAERKAVPVDWCEALENASARDEYPSEKKALYEKLYTAVEGLGQKQRTVIILYYFNGFSIGEIAEMTGTLEATVKTRLFAARKRLKQVLEAEEDAL